MDIYTYILLYLKQIIKNLTQKGLTNRQSKDMPKTTNFVYNPFDRYFKSNQNNQNTNLNNIQRQSICLTNSQQPNCKTQHSQSSCIMRVSHNRQMKEDQRNKKNFKGKVEQEGQNIIQKKKHNYLRKNSRQFLATSRSSTSISKQKQLQKAVNVVDTKRKNSSIIHKPNNQNNSNITNIISKTTPLLSQLNKNPKKVNNMEISQSASRPNFKYKINKQLIQLQKLMDEDSIDATDLNLDVLKPPESKSINISAYLAPKHKHNPNSNQNSNMNMSISQINMNNQIKGVLYGMPKSNKSGEMSQIATFGSDAFKKISTEAGNMIKYANNQQFKSSKKFKQDNNQSKNLLITSRMQGQKMKIDQQSLNSTIAHNLKITPESSLNPSKSLPTRQPEPYTYLNPTLPPKPPNTPTSYLPKHQISIHPLLAYLYRSESLLWERVGSSFALRVYSKGRREIRYADGTVELTANYGGEDLRLVVWGGGDYRFSVGEYVVYWCQEVGEIDQYYLS